MNGIHLRYRDLVAMGACGDKERFRERFGSEVLATVTTAVAHAYEFDWFWIGSADGQTVLD